MAIIVNDRELALRGTVPRAYRSPKTFQSTVAPWTNVKGEEVLVNLLKTPSTVVTNPSTSVFANIYTTSGTGVHEVVLADAVAVEDGNNDIKVIYYVKPYLDAARFKLTVSLSDGSSYVATITSSYQNLGASTATGQFSSGVQFGTYLLENGWYRVTFIGQATTTAATLSVKLGIQDASGNDSYTGSANLGAYLFGFFVDVKANLDNEQVVSDQWLNPVTGSSYTWDGESWKAAVGAGSKWVDYIFTRSTIPPTVPTAEGIPSGWYNNPPPKAGGFGAASSYNVKQPDIISYISQDFHQKNVELLIPSQEGPSELTAASTSENTILLLHMDGDPGSSSFSDSSKYTRAIATNGDVQHSTAQARFGTTSAVFTGTNWLRTEAASEFNLGTVDFTAEAWVYPTNTVGYRAIISFGTSGTSALYISSGAPVFYMQGLGQLTFQTSLVADTWNHVAIVRQGNTFWLYLNGVKSTASMSTTNSMPAQTQFVIGASTNTGTEGFIGYIDEVRVVRGEALYLDTFTPPTSAYPSIPSLYMQLLLHFNGSNGATSFVDSSGRNYTVESSGATLTTTSPKFGSACLDTSLGGAYAVAAGTPVRPFTFGKPFVVDFWCKLDNLMSNYILLKKVGQDTPPGGVTRIDDTISIEYDHTLNKILAKGSAYSTPGPGTAFNIGSSGSVDITADTWYHVALQWHTTGTVNLFINGQVCGSASYSSDLFIGTNYASPLLIGSGVSNSSNLVGKLDELRLIMNKSMYAADTPFIPPTSPYEDGASSSSALANPVNLAYNNTIPVAIGNVTLEEVTTAPSNYAYAFLTEGAAINTNLYADLGTKDFCLDLSIKRLTPMVNIGWEVLFTSGFATLNTSNITVYQDTSTGTFKARVYTGPTTFIEASGGTSSTVGQEIHLSVIRKGLWISVINKTSQWLESSVYIGSSSIKPQTSPYIIGSTHSYSNRSRSAIWDVRLTVGVNRFYETLDTYLPDPFMKGPYTPPYVLPETGDPVFCYQSKVVNFLNYDKPNGLFYDYGGNPYYFNPTDLAPFTPTPAGLIKLVGPIDNSPALDLGVAYAINNYTPLYYKDVYSQYSGSGDIHGGGSSLFYPGQSDVGLRATFKFSNLSLMLDGWVCRLSIEGDPYKACLGIKILDDCTGVVIELPNDTTQTVSYSFALGQWYDFAVTRVAQVVRAYINGVVIGTYDLQDVRPYIPKSTPCFAGLNGTEGLQRMSQGLLSHAEAITGLFNEEEFLSASVFRSAPIIDPGYLNLGNMGTEAYSIIRNSSSGILNLGNGSASTTVTAGSNVHTVDSILFSDKAFKIANPPGVGDEDNVLSFNVPDTSPTECTLEFWFTCTSKVFSPTDELTLFSISNGEGTAGIEVKLSGISGSGMGLEVKALSNGISYVLGDSLKNIFVDSILRNPQPIRMVYSGGDVRIMDRLASSLSSNIKISIPAVDRQTLLSPVIKIGGTNIGGHELIVEDISYYTYLRYPESFRQYKVNFSYPNFQQVRSVLPTGLAGLLYMSKAEKSLPSNLLVTPWAVPVQLEGDPGADGVSGADGAPGTTLYTWVKYADSPTTGMSDSPLGKSYVGFAYNKTTEVESTDYTEYAWSLLTSPGANGASTHRIYYKGMPAVQPATPGTTVSGATPAGWSATPVTLAESEAQWQADGVTEAGSTTTVWLTPYLSYFKVGSLSAITANVGTLDISPAGHIKSGQTAFNTGSGFFLGNDGGVAKFSIGSGAGNRMYWNGTNLIIEVDTSNIVTVGDTNQQDIYSYGASDGHAYAGIAFDSQGRISKRGGGDSSTYEVVAGRSYYQPNTAGIGSSRWINVNGEGWTSLTSGHIIQIVRTSPGKITQNYTYQISSSATGTPVVSTGSFVLEAENLSTPPPAGGSNDISQPSLEAYGFRIGGTSAITAGIRFETDGTITRAQTTSTYVAYTGKSYYSPTTAGIGSSRWIRFDGTGSWSSLSSSVPISITIGSGEFYDTSTHTYQIASDSGGATVVSTGTIYLTVERESGL